MSPARERATVSDNAPDAALVESVRTVLERGALAVLPTETVYGIAARADSKAALARLFELKDRPAEMALTWHVGSPTALDRYPEVSPLARRLVARYWPGPLTLVLPGVPPGLELASRDGWTGVRLPAHLTTAGILAALPFPVVMTSANRHGAPPATSAAELESLIDENVALVVDGGPSRMAEASCVMRLGRGRFELLRAGLFTVEQLRAVAGLKLAFVCTGNTCRSPIAEALAKNLLAQRLQTPLEKLADFGFSVQSMGIHAAVGSKASKLSVDVLNEDGIDLSEHRAQAATLEELSKQDRVYGLTRAHVEELRMILPPARTKIVALLDPDGNDISDPIGGPRADYERAAREIRAAITARLDEWA